MIREFSETVGDAVLRRVGRAYGRVQERTPLQADVLESDEEFLIVVDAPGAAASDVQVKYAEDRVLVRMDRFREFHDGYEMRFPGRGLALDGEVELPDDAEIDPERANATLTDHGTLEIRVPKIQGEGAVGEVGETVAVDDEGEPSAVDVDDAGADADADDHPHDADDGGADADGNADDDADDDR